MSSLDDSGAIFKYHRHMAALHGAGSSLALGWREFADQSARFEVLSGIADLNGKTVLDAGCGYGDLFAFLSSRYTIAHYYGVEQIPEMIGQAEENYGSLANTSFIPGNFLSSALPVTDYILASGSLNYGSSDPGYIFNAITLLFESCTRGLGFNLLSLVPDNGLLVAYEPEVILAYCRTLSNHVNLVVGYSNEDFTIFMFY